MSGNFVLLSVFLMGIHSVFLSRAIQIDERPRSLFGSQHIVVAVQPRPIYVDFQVDHHGNLTNVEGFVPKIVEWLAEKHNFTYRYIKPADDAWGVIENGTWNGLIGLVVRGEADLAGTDLSITYARASVVDFTYAFANDPMALLAPYPRLASTISGLVRPFHYTVWIGIILSLLIASICLYLIKHVESRIIKKKRTHKTVVDQLWILFRVLTNPAEVLDLTPSTQILLACWCLAAFVFVQSYTCCLVSYLMLPKFIPYVNTIEDLVHSNEVTLVVRKFTSVESDLAAATSGPLQKLGDKLRAHPENILSNWDNIEDMVAIEHKVVTQEKLINELIIYNDFKKTNQCRLVNAKEYLLDNRCAFAMSKSNPLMTKIFNYDLIWMHDTGLIQYWIKSYLPNPNECSAQLSSSRPKSKKKKLTLNFLSSAFLLYGIGVALSFLVFVHELIARRCV